jgi:hypothetical protein
MVKTIFIIDFTISGLGYSTRQSIFGRIMKQRVGLFMHTTLTKLGLKRLITTHNPDFCLIVEPWMDFARYPKTWLARLNLKMFAVNSRHNLIPNLWYLCLDHLSPSFILISDQHVSFTLVEDGKTFGVSTVYASTSYVKRMSLWQSLTYIHNQYNLP